MRILCLGSFLAEGLAKLGHTVVRGRFDAARPVNEQIAALCPEPDLILWEIWDHTALPPDLRECGVPLAAFCIDSCINEYWLKEILWLFDHVFVDQQSSVESLGRYGINAVWLPLCVPESAFRGPSPKDHDISFVGRMSDYRIKRRNLIRHLSAHRPVNLVQGVSSSAMLDIFARSRIVLNENLFSGLTLRVFQGMAAGSLVLTETGGRGVDAHFQDHIDLHCFEPHSLIPDVREILDNEAKFSAVARQGQELCRLRHTSRARAGEFLAHVHTKGAANARLSPERRKLHEARAKYALALRFGGDYSQAVILLEELLRSGGETAGEAALTLGNIHARAGRDEKALALYARAAETHPGPAHMKTALLFAYDEKMEEARTLLRGMLAALPEEPAGAQAGLAASGGPEEKMGAFLFVLARAYRSLGQTFHMGFLKQEQDRFPDTDLEMAFLAWRQCPAPEILDFLLEGGALLGIEGEFLPMCLEAIETGLATDRQIIKAAELAERYYDKGLAKAITGSLKRSRRKKP